MKAEVKIHADELMEKLRGRVEQYSGKRHKAMAQAALAVEREAKRRAPVGTGLLRRSITHRVVMDGDDVVAQIGTNVHYAIHVEYGHRTRRGAEDGRCRPQRTRTGTREPIHYVRGRYFLAHAIKVKREAVVRILTQGLRGEA